jgi:hypothetical protein
MTEKQRDFNTCSDVCRDVAKYVEWRKQSSRKSVNTASRETERRCDIETNEQRTWRHGDNDAGKKRDSGIRGQRDNLHTSRFNIHIYIAKFQQTGGLFGLVAAALENDLHFSISCANLKGKNPPRGWDSSFYPGTLPQYTPPPVSASDW